MSGEPVSAVAAPDCRAPRLILASTSPSRRAILTGAHIRHEVCPSRVDEDAVLAAAEREAEQALSLPEQVSVLAHAKALDVAARLGAELAAPAVRGPHTANRPATSLIPDTSPIPATAAAPAPDTPPAPGAATDVPALLILGCDSLFELDGQALGKPHTPERARERLRQMAGRTGLLHTGHCLVSVNAAGEIAGVEQVARVASVVVAELSDTDIEAYIATGEPLQVAGSFTLEGYGGPFIERIEGDHHTVLGLSLVALRALLAQAGVAITDLWEPSPDPR